MATKKPQPFYWRSFVTFYMVLSFLIIAISGVVLYFAPPGRIANWSEWTFLSLTKASWQAVHTTATFLFVVAVAFHLFFNWRVLMAYLKTKLDAGIRRGRELALASALIVGIVGLTLASVPPFATVMTLGETLKNSWATPSTEPPVPHAEEWTLAKLAETAKVPLDQVLANLKTRGMVPTGPDVTLLALADEHKRTPRDIYRVALGDAQPAASPLAEGGGYGRRTVEDISRQMGLSIETALDRLRRHGLEATPSSTVRELATKSGKKPIDVIKLLEQ